MCICNSFYGLFQRQCHGKMGLSVNSFYLRHRLSSCKFWNANTFSFFSTFTLGIIIKSCSTPPFNNNNNNKRLKRLWAKLSDLEVKTSNLCLFVVRPQKFQVIYRWPHLTFYNFICSHIYSYKENGLHLALTATQRRNRKGETYRCGLGRTPK